MTIADDENSPVKSTVFGLNVPATTYFLPTAGIGTYVHSNTYSHTSIFTRLYSWFQKARDSAIGSSFAEHVMGGYKFLMRYYSQGDGELPALPRRWAIVDRLGQTYTYSASVAALT